MLTHMRKGLSYLLIKYCTLSDKLMNLFSQFLKIFLSVKLQIKMKVLLQDIKQLNLWQTILPSFQIFNCSLRNTFIAEYLNSKTLVKYRFKKPDVQICLIITINNSQEQNNPLLLLRNKNSSNFWNKRTLKGFL